jgi:hypothetical protein
MTMLEFRDDAATMLKWASASIVALTAIIVVASVLWPSWT